MTARRQSHTGRRHSAVCALLFSAALAALPAMAQSVLSDDAVRPPLPSTVERLTASLPALSSNSSANLSASSHSTISLMVLHDPALPGGNAAIAELLETTNTIYQQSGVNVTFELAVSVPYSAAGSSNGAALREITDSSEVANLRTLYGADMVTLLRPYDRETHGGCGQAWLIGWAGFDPFAFPGYVYDYAHSVASVGSDGRFFCDEASLAHELGHNFGAVHDSSNTNSEPRLPYAYGWGFDGSFGTVMSYINPDVPYFSTPDLSACNGFVCGNPIEADVVRAINEVRDAFAALSPDISAPDAPTITGSTASVDSISLSFTTPDDGGAEILDYTAQCNSVMATDSESPILITGLQPTTEYSCDVTARNTSGTSPASASINLLTLPIPNPTIAAIEVWDEELTVRIEPAGVAGSYQLLEHRVTCGAQTIVTTGNQVTFTGLMNNTSYSCSVTAVTNIGDSGASPMLSGTPEPGANGIDLLVIKAALDKQ
jgi:chitodextrinase